MNHGFQVLHVLATVPARAQQATGGTRLGWATAVRHRGARTTSPPGRRPARNPSGRRARPPAASPGRPPPRRPRPAPAPERQHRDTKTAALGHPGPDPGAAHDATALPPAPAGKGTPGAGGGHRAHARPTYPRTSSQDQPPPRPVRGNAGGAHRPSKLCIPTVRTAHADRPDSPDARPLCVRGHRNMTACSATR